MLILIDARAIENKIDGIGRFSLNLLKHLNLFPSISFNVLILDNLTLELPSHENIKYIKVFINRFSLFENRRIAKLVNNTNPDIYLNTSQYIPTGIHCKCIMVVHDLMACFFRLFFDDLGFLSRKLAVYYFRRLMKKSISGSTKIITVSHYTAQELQKRYNLQKSKTLIVSEASEFFIPNKLNDTEKDNIRKEMHLPEDYFLHVSNLKSYKNINNILLAYRKFLNDNKNNRNIKFIFTTKKQRKRNRAFWNLVHKFNLENNIIGLNNLPNSKMPYLYYLSRGLYFPSLMEGFGLPVIEAMACRTPVVTSKGIVTEEVACGNAYLVDPENADSLVDGLYYLINFTNRNSKIEKAYNYATTLSWEKTTDLIINDCKSKIL